MKKLIYRLAASLLVGGLAWSAVQAEELVILHTNDTHSQMDPYTNGLGGIQRRKAVVDSVRAVQPNVLLVDAGDAVQGTLFFSLYGGEAEMKAMNALGYDLAVLGNHDFDNGMEPLAKNISNNNATWITTNYNLDSSLLAGKFAPYVIKEYGGRKMGFIGINLDPKGMISEGHYDGVEYLDAYKAANSTAWVMKHLQGVDLVVVISHIGYDSKPGPRDLDLAAQSEDIDVIIGGHSHTIVDPQTEAGHVKNLLGKDVLIAQAGQRGGKIGEITIDLDSLTAKGRLITLDSRLDSYNDPALEAALTPYRHGIDSIMQVNIGKAKILLDLPREMNLFSDMALKRARQIVDGNVDLAIINKGGIRRPIPKGKVSEGQIMITLPFDNSVVVMDISGKDLKDAFDVMADRDGDAVSANVDAIIGADGTCTQILIDGKPIDVNRTYRLATIDYLANGGDYMEPLTRGTAVARSENILYRDIINMIRADKNALTAPATARMHK
jgi:5'-nucleotidase